MVIDLVKRFIQIVDEKGMNAAIDSTVMFLFSALGLRHYVDILRAKKKVSKLSDATDNAIHINYNSNSASDLARLCDEYGTDKGELTPDSNPYPWASHNYSDFYELIFSSRRSSVESLLECGIGTPNTEFPSSMGEEANPGASLRVWRDYFPNAEVTGIDIDPEVMFSEDRINTYCVDQTSEESIKEFLDSQNGDFDIIIDDGLHQYHANVSLFENTIDRLSEDGTYVIEDVSYDNLDKYQEYFTSGLEQYHTKFIDLENPNRPYRKQDRLIMITPT